MELRLLTRLFPAEKTFFANEVYERNDSMYMDISKKSCCRVSQMIYSTRLDSCGYYITCHVGALFMN